jgi:hypothetical protein
MQLKRWQAVYSIGAGAVVCTIALVLPNVGTWLVALTFLLQFVVPYILLFRFKFESEQPDRWTRQWHITAAFGAAMLLVVVGNLVPALRVPLLVLSSWVWFFVYLRSVQQARPLTH